MFLNNYVEKNISDWYWTSQEKKPNRGRRGRGEGGGGWGYGSSSGIKDIACAISRG